MTVSENRKNLIWIYNQLYQFFGPQHWWPARTPFEVMIGAILTQNTSWLNVEKAINNLKRDNLLEIEKIKHLNTDKLASIIKPAGYYNIKARRIKNLVKLLCSIYSSDFDKMSDLDLSKLRTELLSINGIGPETADSILLYALNKPVFVIDAYTRRVLARHNILDEEATYECFQIYFMNNLPHDIRLFKEFHALLVQLGKNICRKVPACDVCPLKTLKNI